MNQGDTNGETTRERPRFRSLPVMRAPGHRRRRTNRARWVWRAGALLLLGAVGASPPLCPACPAPGFAQAFRGASLHTAGMSAPRVAQPQAATTAASASTVTMPPAIGVAVLHRVETSGQRSTPTLELLGDTQSDLAFARADRLSHHVLGLLITIDASCYSQAPPAAPAPEASRAVDLCSPTAVAPAPAKSLPVLLPGKVLPGALLRLPFAGMYPTTQPYGPTSLRIEPSYDGYPHFHTGLDYGLPRGTPVGAAAAGRVLAAGWDPSGFGNRVLIDHGHGLQTLYGHLERVLVKPGQVVAAGQEIGLSGNTGNSTGPHLHFGVRFEGIWVNPTACLRASKRPGAAILLTVPPPPRHASASRASRRPSSTAYFTPSPTRAAARPSRTYAAVVAVTRYPSPAAPTATLVPPSPTITAASTIAVTSTSTSTPTPTWTPLLPSSTPTATASPTITPSATITTTATATASATLGLPTGTPIPALTATGAPSPTQTPVAFGSPADPGDTATSSDSPSPSDAVIVMGQDTATSTPS